MCWSPAKNICMTRCQDLGPWWQRYIKESLYMKGLDQLHQTNLWSSVKIHTLNIDKRPYCLLFAHASSHLLITACNWCQSEIYITFLSKPECFVVMLRACHSHLPITSQSNPAILDRWNICSVHSWAIGIRWMLGVIGGKYIYYSK